MSESTKRPGPGLYLHLPFCSTICPYCDFYVLTGDHHRRQRFVDHLIGEIRLCGQHPWPSFVDHSIDAPFETIYLGGGTPSLLEPQQLQRVLDVLRDSLPIVEEPWIGLEANPEHLSSENLGSWQSLGVTFLSLGVQSFDDWKLEFLGRTHSADGARSSLALARQSGIESLSVDLIYGLPEETTKQWSQDLECAISFEPDHLSCYQLTIEPGTSFGFRLQRGQMVEVSSETQAERFLFTHRRLEEAGLVAYEVSNFATKPEHRSRHNMKYWDHTPYLGLGPAAHSFAARRRWWNLRKIKPYMESLDHRRRPIDGHEELDIEALCLERLMLGLRTPSGVDFESFPDGTGASIWHRNQDLIAELSDSGLVTIEDFHLLPTLSGLLLAEALARRFDIPANLSPEQAGIC